MAHAKPSDPATSSKFGTCTWIWSTCTSGPWRLPTKFSYSIFQIHGYVSCTMHNLMKKCMNTGGNGSDESSRSKTIYKGFKGLLDQAVMNTFIFCGVDSRKISYFFHAASIYLLFLQIPKRSFLYKIKDKIEFPQSSLISLWDLLFRTTGHVSAPWNHLARMRCPAEKYRQKRVTARPPSWGQNRAHFPATHFM